MPTIVTRHKVKDFATWLKGHRDRVDLFAPAVSSFKTFQDTDDPNSILLVIEATDLDLLAAIINDPKNQGIKDLHIVLEPITLLMPVAV